MHKNKVLILEYSQMKGIVGKTNNTYESVYPLRQEDFIMNLYIHYRDYQREKKTNNTDGFPQGQSKLFHTWFKTLFMTKY